MFLTRLYVNPQRRNSRRLLGSPQAMHAAVLSGFGPEVSAGRVLWRLDGSGSHHPALLIVSAAKPDCTHLVEQAGWPEQSPATSTHYSPFLDQLAAGQHWSFRLAANPVHRAAINGHKKIVGHVTADHQLRWLLDRAQDIGLRLRDGEQQTCTITSRRILTFRRQGGRVTIAQAVFEGGAVVTDPGALKAALIGGVGRAKAYGCGLLTLAR